MAPVVSIKAAEYRQDRAKRNYSGSRKRQLAPVAEANEPAPVAEQNSVFLKRHDLLRSFSGDVGIFFTSRMKVRQVMTRNVVRVLPSESMDEVRRLLTEKRIRHVLVCDKNDRLLGVISDRDIHAATARVAKDAMAADLVSVAPKTLVNPAVTLLLQKRISCLPVVDERRVVGVVTTTDLLMALQCTNDMMSARVSSSSTSRIDGASFMKFS